MPHYRLCLIGFGNVGQAFARLIIRKGELLKTERGLTVSVTGIRTGRHGAAIDPDGIDLARALLLAGQGGSLGELSAQPAPQDGLEFIRACPADVLFENSPVNHKTGQPAIDHLKAGLKQGMHVITANKGPVVHGYHELRQLAAECQRKFMFESTVMDGAPIFSLFRETLPAVELRSFSGILNSCTNLILTRMEQGESFDQAVSYAQSIGIAETDPSADVDGWDAAIKVAALITVLMNVPFTPQMVERQGIREVSADMLANAQSQGKRWKLVCSARRMELSAIGSVKPEMVSADSPLYSINGTSSYCQFETDVLPGLGVVESDPGPETTAYGLLADFLNVVK
jgi:homoserine dehydrogenase